MGNSGDWIARNRRESEDEGGKHASRKLLDPQGLSIRDKEQKPRFLPRPIKRIRGARLWSFGGDSELL